MTSSIKSFGRQAFIYGTGNVMTRLVTFFLLPLLTNILSVEEYGIVALVYVFLGFMNIVYHYGLDSAFLRFAGETYDPIELRKRFSTAFWLSIVTSAVLSLLIASLSRPLAQLIAGSLESEKLFVYCAGILFLDTIAIVPLAFLRLRNRAVQFTTIRMLNVLTTLGLSIYLVAVMKIGINGVFLSVLAASMVTAAGSFLTALPEIRLSFSAVVAKNLVKFGLPFVPAGLASIAMEMIDRIILQHLKDTATVGIYSAGYKLGIFMLLITTAFNYAWQPFFLKQGDKPESKPLFSRIFTLYAALSLFVWLAITLFIPEIIRINISGYSLIGPDYYYAETIVPFILIAYVLQGAYFNFLPGIYFAKKTGYIALVTVAGAVVNIILNFVLIPPYGITGAALATIAGHGTMAVATYFISRRFFVVPYKWGNIVTLLTATGIAITAPQLLGNNVLLRAIVMLFYTVMVLLFIVQGAGIVKGSSGKPRVLVFSAFHQPFISADLEYIGTFAHVRHLLSSGLGAVVRLLFAVPTRDVVVAWFASVYSAVIVFLCRIFGKRSVIILGGVDAVSVPEINYGIWLSRWRIPFVKYAIRNADSVLSVAPSLIENVKTLADYPGQNLHYLPTAYDTNFWKPDGLKKRRVLTVGASDNEIRLKKKGIDFLLAAAEKLNDTEFIIVGIEEKLLLKLGWEIPHNVRLVPPAPQNTLLTFFQESLVFCQPSRSEGMPNTLCEAMSCGCIPVGTNVDGIPIAIGDSGYIVPLGDIDALVNALQEALQQDKSAGEAARQRIIQEFPPERRITGLRKAIAGESMK